MIEGDDDNGDISDEETEPQLSTVGPEDLDVVYENTQDHLYGLKNKELVKVLNKNTPRRIIRPTPQRSQRSGRCSRASAAGRLDGCWTFGR